MTTISIKGMSCQHCVASTTKALKNIPGVSNVKVDLDRNEASYEGDVASELIQDAVSKIGFEVIN